MIDSKYFKAYRMRLGFSNQNGAKRFFAAKDITPTVDYAYIDLQQMEGQTVFNIDQNFFIWKLTEKPPYFDMSKLLKR